MLSKLRLFWRTFYYLESIPTRIRRYRYMRSEEWEKDKQRFKARTGFSLDDPIFGEYKYVAVNGGEGYYFHPEQKGKKFQPLNGQMVEVG